MGFLTLLSNIILYRFLALTFPARISNIIVGIFAEFRTAVETVSHFDFHG
jgi:hypothetical protein